MPQLTGLSTIDELLAQEQLNAARLLAWLRLIMAVAGVGIMLLVVLFKFKFESGDLGPSVAGAFIYFALAVAMLRITVASPLGRWSALGVALMDVPVLTVIHYVQQPLLQQMWHGLPTRIAFNCGLVAFSVLSLSRPVVILTALAALASIELTLLRTFVDPPLGILLLTGLMPLSIGFVGLTLVRRLRLWVTEMRQRDMTAADALRERVEELECKEKELQALNSELRRQVVEKSRALVTSIHRDGSIAARLPAENEIFDSRYRVVRVLGRGGMGAVFEVSRLADNKAFALKLMIGKADADASTRFLREAELAARISHANLVSVVDVGTSNTGSLFLVMELVHGRSLEQFTEKWIDRAWSLSVLSQVARGVEALHHEQVVHRDLKPANVLVWEQQGLPRVKISDFGIARQLEMVDPVGDTATPENKDFTRTGATIGTPRYLPPEVVGNARAATANADVFSFGVMACEVLCATYPFLLPPSLEVMAGRPPSDANTAFLGTAGLPARLVEVLVRSLAVRPQSRPSASELLAALEEASAGAGRLTDRVSTGS